MKDVFLGACAFLMLFSFVSAGNCLDSDDGKNIYVSGFAKSDNHIHVDACMKSIDDDDESVINNVNDCVGDDCFLKEGVCSDGEAIFVKVECSQCSLGRCLVDGSFEVEYILKKDGQEYVLYVLPKHGGEDRSDILITAGFHGPSRSSSWSNDPANRFPKEFVFNRDVNAYRIGSFSESEFSDFEILEIKLSFGESESKEWKIFLSDVEIGKRVIFEIDSSDGVDSGDDICIDSDGGRSMHVFGIAKSDGFSYSDRCVESVSLNADERDVDSCEEESCFLKEAICLRGEVNYAKLACDTYCSNGRCSAVTSLDVYYFLREGGDDYILYVLPKHDSVRYSDVYITAGFHSSDQVKSWSNNPANKFSENFDFIESANAYRIGSISKDDFSEFDSLKITLDARGNEFRFWEVNLNDVSIDKVVEIEPIDEPIDMNTGDEHEDVDIEFACQGCEADGKCYPLGYRKDKKFCLDNGEFIEQRVENSGCDNNFECSSNLCINDRCISSGLWSKFVRWIEKFF